MRCQSAHLIGKSRGHILMMPIASALLLLLLIAAAAEKIVGLIHKNKTGYALRKRHTRHKIFGV